MMVLNWNYNQSPKNTPDVTGLVNELMSKVQDVQRELINQVTEGGKYVLRETWDNNIDHMIYRCVLVPEDFKQELPFDELKKLFPSREIIFKSTS